MSRTGLGRENVEGKLNLLFEDPLGRSVIAAAGPREAGIYYSQTRTVLR